MHFETVPPGRGRAAARRRWPIVALVIACTAVLAVLAAGAPVPPRLRPPAAAPAGAPAAAPSPAPSPAPRPSPVPGAAERAELTRALDAYLDERPGSVSLAVRDASGEVSYDYGDGLRTATASIVKVNIVMALLLRAQRAGRPLTRAERDLAERAVTVSDNDAASALWRTIGGAEGLAAANEDLGPRDTAPGPGGFWGSTTTSAADQAELLTALVSPASPLSAPNRRYVRDLMAGVVPAQAWGVSAAADPSAEPVLKNGWLPRDAHGGRWTINSIGLVRAAGRLLLIAVLSERHPSMRAGIETVERAARTVTAALDRPHEHR
ncbi:serine hydrolase [Actinomadura sp. WMMB 499]|uniref:serine hydrolase n=1 Tax=Actinomadura sp. WMMB 499 TaxID=1219491 RepID=UPI001248D439|nr:serine hydrolase [Actinomadura sp. WMMB 499]QFG21030.1 serine hydrolase [Actinomadura sp. WMMB 499]